MSKLHIGVIKWIDHNKGYAVVIDNDSIEYFMHSSNNNHFNTFNFLTPIYFESSMFKKKRTAVNAFIPNTFEDFAYLSTIAINKLQIYSNSISYSLNISTRCFCSLIDKKELNTVIEWMKEVFVSNNNAANQAQFFKLIYSASFFKNTIQFSDINTSTIKIDWDNYFLENHEEKVIFLKEFVNFIAKKLDKETLFLLWIDGFNIVSNEFKFDKSFLIPTISENLDLFCVKVIEKLINSNYDHSVIIEIVVHLFNYVLRSDTGNKYLWVLIALHKKDILTQEAFLLIEKTLTMQDYAILINAEYLKVEGGSLKCFGYNYVLDFDRSYTLSEYIVQQKYVSPFYYGVFTVDVNNSNFWKIIKFLNIREHVKSFILKAYRRLVWGFNIDEDVLFIKGFLNNYLKSHESKYIDTTELLNIFIILETDYDLSDCFKNNFSRFTIGQILTLFDFFMLSVDKSNKCRFSFQNFSFELNKNDALFVSSIMLNKFRNSNDDSEKICLYLLHLNIEDDIKKLVDYVKNHRFNLNIYLEITKSIFDLEICDRYIELLHKEIDSIRNQPTRYTWYCTVEDISLSVNLSFEYYSCKTLDKINSGVEEFIDILFEKLDEIGISEFEKHYKKIAFNILPQCLLRVLSKYSKHRNFRFLILDYNILDRIIYNNADLSLLEKITSILATSNSSEKELVVIKMFSIYKNFELNIPIVCSNDTLYEALNWIERNNLKITPNTYNYLKTLVKDLNLNIDSITKLLQKFNNNHSIKFLLESVDPNVLDLSSVNNLLNVLSSKAKDSTNENNYLVSAYFIFSLKSYIIFPDSIKEDPLFRKFFEINPIKSLETFLKLGNYGVISMLNLYKVKPKDLLNKSIYNLYKKHCTSNKNCNEFARYVLPLITPTEDNLMNWYDSSIKFLITGAVNYKLKYYALYQYYSLRNFPDLNFYERKLRERILSFKEGNSKDFSDEISSAIINLKIFGDLIIDDNVVIMSIPASSSTKTINRFDLFTKIVSKNLECIQVNAAISNIENRTPKHEGNRNVNILEGIKFNSDYFIEKTVFLFDDIITTGSSFSQIAERLIVLGAKDVIGFFIAKTE